VISHGRALDRYNAAWQHMPTRLAYQVLGFEARRHYKTTRGEIQFMIFCQDAAIAWCKAPPYYGLTFYRRLMRRTVGDARLRLAAQLFIRMVGEYGAGDR